MHSVGEKLRNERQRQNRSLSAIAGETCISSRYLQAIEEDDLSPLPGVFFYKSFVKQYTGALGMDYRTIESDVERMAPVEEVDPLPALSASYQIAKTEGRITRFPRNRAAWSGALLLITLAGGGGVYRWWQKGQSGPGDVPTGVVRVTEITPAASAPAAVSPAPVSTTLPEQIPAADSATQSSRQETAPEPIVRNEPAKLSVDLSAKEKTWVSLTSDGKTVFRGVLDPSQTKNIEGWENAKLLTGNAAGLDVRWNGKPIGPLGTHGQVRVVVFTPENFQILSPRKM